ncbi:uncharacterized protein BP5553_01384 [Venustampulla echinocandica]|uniref:Uncharacterized protein n=1 Tax=Venustampulla echinocandica TaxID=2656787 RepID=A0A370U0W9_9HELO|nr:uncharacterized protein BP5553_01384 [Venustampulla echinocandica]RDL41405.1 hypothetical protein BP5553_01384 [Venustampulla echinocandica]
MAQVELAEPPAYDDHDWDTVLDEAPEDLGSRDITHHINVAIRLARDTHRVCTKHSEAFLSLAHDVGAYYALLEAIVESIADHGVNDEQTKSVMHNLSASKDCLLDLQALVTRYRDLPTASQRTWDHSMRRTEESGGLQGRIRASINLLANLNSNITSSSQTGVTEMLQKYISEARRGHREGSIFVRQNLQPLREDQSTMWQQFQKELQDVGITPEIFKRDQLFIKTILLKAMVEDQAQEIPRSSRNEVDMDLAKRLAATTKIQGTAYGGPGESKSTPSSSKGEPNSGFKKISTPRKVNSHMSGTKQTLFSAICRDDLTLVRQLLDEGMDIDSRDDINGGDTPLITAVAYDQVDIAELLLERGANIEAKTYHSEETALIKAAASGRYKILLLILEKRPDLEARDRNDRTALFRACSSGYGEEVSALLAARADIGAKDKNNRTPLMEASRLAYKPTVQLLIKHGAARR